MGYRTFATSPFATRIFATTQIATRSFATRYHLLLRNHCYYNPNATTHSKICEGHT